MSVLTTGLCDSLKTEMLQGAHCFSATQSGVTCTCSSTTAMTALASTAGLSVGMKVTGTNSAANTFISNVLTGTTLTISVASTGALTSATFTGDIFNILLVKAGASRTYDHTQTNVGTPGTSAGSTSNLGTDELTNTSGAAYTSGGLAMTNVTPVLSSTTAVVTFSPNPSWTTATFTTTGALISNQNTGSTNSRLGAAAAPITGRTIGAFDFGGSQAVSAGTFTLVMPTADSSNALIRFS